VASIKAFAYIHLHAHFTHTQSNNKEKNKNRDISHYPPKYIAGGSGRKSTTMLVYYENMEGEKKSGPAATVLLFFFSPSVHPFENSPLPAHRQTLGRDVWWTTAERAVNDKTVLVPKTLRTFTISKSSATLLLYIPTRRFHLPVSRFFRRYFQRAPTKVATLLFPPLK
jgi:hypothetical protein